MQSATWQEALDVMWAVQVSMTGSMGQVFLALEKACILPDNAWTWWLGSMQLNAGRTEGCREAAHAAAYVQSSSAQAPVSLPAAA